MYMQSYGTTVINSVGLQTRLSGDVPLVTVAKIGISGKGMYCFVGVSVSCSEAQGEHKDDIP